MAIGAYRKLHEVGLTPGKDIAINTGVLTGDVPDYLSPRLTGFTLTVRELGNAHGRSDARAAAGASGPTTTVRLFRRSGRFN